MEGFLEVIWGSSGNLKNLNDIASLGSPIKSSSKKRQVERQVESQEESQVGL